MRHAPFHSGLMFWNFGSMLLLALAVALLVLWLLKRKGGPRHHSAHHPGWQPGPPPFPPQPSSSALQILEERLARGDIDVDDYLSRRSALLGDRPNGTEFNPGGPPEAPEAPRAVRPEDDSQA